MLKGYTTPRTPRGTSGLAPAPPWHYACNCLAVEFQAEADRVAAFLPEGLAADGGACAAYFTEWQFVTDAGDEYLDPVTSQYTEAIFLVSARYAGEAAAYCPFIFVSQDTALMRGLAQGWPKQIGSVWITRSSTLVSPAAPVEGPGGRFGASLSFKERRLANAQVTLREQTLKRPVPGFERGINVRYFPELERGKHDRPAVHELVQLRSSNVQFSPIWTGEASLELLDHPTLELADLRPVSVGAGYRFSFAFTVDDVAPLRDLRGAP